MKDDKHSSIQKETHSIVAPIVNAYTVNRHSTALMPHRSTQNIISWTIL